MVDVAEIKKQFPLFANHPDLIYFDNAATTQRPQQVINAISHFYQNENANIHRGVYQLSAQSTQRYEAVRVQTASFIGASDASCIAFTSGTTAGINTVAIGYLKARLKAGDNIVVSALEHHANLLPWQMLAKEKEADLRIIPVDEKGDLKLDQLSLLLDENTQLVALTAISNSLGTIVPLKKIIDQAHQKDIPVLVDGAQSTGYYPLDVTALDVDFYTFSGHKMFGPFGVGVLYVHPRHHTQILPMQYGGGMIERVGFEESSYLGYPKNLEGGTPNVAGVIGLGAAIDFCKQLDRIAITTYLKELTSYAKEALRKIEGLRLVGDPTEFGSIISFTMESVHPHDLAQFLGEEGIAVRAGHHCTQPLLEAMGFSATVRASFSIYNSDKEVDKLVKVLTEIKKFWS